MPGPRVVIRDSGRRVERTLLSRLRLASTVEVGILGPKARAYKKGNKVTVGEVASWLEYGTKSQRPRPAVGGWFDRERANNIAFARVLARRRLLGQMTIDQSLAAMGARSVGGIQKSIADGISPPNAPSTIARKKSSKPWIDTGQTRSSFSFRIKSGRVKMR